MDELPYLEQLKDELANKPQSAETLAIILTKLIMLSEVRVDSVHQITRAMASGNESVISTCREEIQKIRENRDALQEALKNALGTIDRLTRKVETLLQDNRTLNKSLAESIAQNTDLVRTIQIVAQSHPVQTMNYNRD